MYWVFLTARVHRKKRAKMTRHAKSSIHISAGKMGYFSHNSREKKTANSIFSDEENFYSCNKKTAIENYKSELAIRSKKYQERTGQKLQKKAITHLTAIVNLKANHTEQDLQKVCDYLEQTFDTKIIQTSIHRDEGHITENGEAIKNYHAHIEFMGLDSFGASIRRKFTKGSLSELQTVTSELLQMERGTNYAKEQLPRPERLATYEFKKVKEQEEKIIKAKVKDLKKEISDLRAALQEKNATRADYVKLEALNKELKERIKDKDLSIEELHTTVKTLKFELQGSKSIHDELDLVKTEKTRLTRDMTFLKLDNQTSKSEVLQLREKVSSLTKQLSGANEHLLKLKSRYNELKSSTASKISELQEQLSEFTRNRFRQ